MVAGCYLPLVHPRGSLEMQATVALGAKWPARATNHHGHRGAVVVVGAQRPLWRRVAFTSPATRSTKQHTYNPRKENFIIQH